MLTKYIEAAMRHAQYEIVEDDNSFYGHISDFSGLWANVPTLEGCREELQSTLEDWTLIGIRQKISFPVVNSIDLLAPAPV